jgi:hypothetical protein
MRRHFRSSLARYGFTICAVVAALNDLLLPAIVSTALAAYAWKNAR